MRNYLKPPYFVILIILCIVALRTVFIGQFDKQLTQNPNEYAAYNMEPKAVVTIDPIRKQTTYESKTGKYSVTFPSDLIIHENFVHVRNSSTYHPVKNVIELDSPQLQKAPYVLIQHAENYTQQSVEEYINNSSECEEVEATKGQRIMVAGVSGIMYKNVHCSDTRETRIYFIRGNMGYNITISADEVDDDFLHSLLTSFHFTN